MISIICARNNEFVHTFAGKSVMGDPDLADALNFLHQRINAEFGAAVVGICISAEKLVEVTVSITVVFYGNASGLSLAEASTSGGKDGRGGEAEGEDASNELHTGRVQY